MTADPQNRAEYEQWKAGVTFAVQTLRRAASQLAAQVEDGCTDPEREMEAETQVWRTAYAAALEGIEALCDGMRALMAEPRP